MTEEKIQVMLVDDIADTRENMKKLLFFEDDIEVVGTAGSGEEGIEIAKKLNPHVVIMDINMPGIDGITAAEILTREVPGIQIIMMSVQGETDYIRRSMLAGAREFLIKPPTVEQVVTSIRRVYALSKQVRGQMQLLQQAQAAVAAIPQTGGQAGAHGQHPGQGAGGKGKGGELIAVFGTKGGVGTSSIAVNMAIAIQEQQPDARVAVLDGNTEFGDLSVLLNLNVQRTIVDLLSVEELEGQVQFVQDAFVPHASGIKVMPGSSPAEAELVSSEQMKRVIDALRGMFNYLIFDTRPTFGEPILTILDNADTIVLVTTADIPSIRNARLFFEVADQLEYPKEKVVLVLNKYDTQGTVSSQAIQASIKHPIVAELPRDDRVANAAIQQGLPYVMGNPRSHLSIATSTLARKLRGVTVEEQQPEAHKQTKAVEEAPVKKRSLFGKLFGR
ncbi:MAG: response regulator [Ardenticatenales bacterium]|nr:response regulator [Ardenticatenales bacterium]